jgi:hypothetical protein
MLNVTLVLLAALFVALAVAVAAEAAVYGGVRERQCDATGHCVEVAIAVETNGASIRAVGNVRCLSASGTYACPAVYGGVVYLYRAVDNPYGSWFECGHDVFPTCGAIEHFSTYWVYNAPYLTQRYQARVTIGSVCDGFNLCASSFDLWSQAVYL